MRKTNVYCSASKYQAITRTRHRMASSTQSACLKLNHCQAQCICFSLPSSRSLGLQFTWLINLSSPSVQSSFCPQRQVMESCLLGGGCIANCLIQLPLSWALWETVALWGLGRDLNWKETWVGEKMSRRHPRHPFGLHPTKPLINTRLCLWYFINRPDKLPWPEVSIT